MPGLQELYLEAAEVSGGATDAQQQRALSALLADNAPEGECTWGAGAASPNPTTDAAVPSALPGAAGDNAADFELLDNEGFVLIEGHGLDFPVPTAAAATPAAQLEMSPMPAAKPVPCTHTGIITYDDYTYDPQEVGAPADADANADADAAGLSCFARPPPLFVDLAALLEQAQSRPPRHRAKARLMRAAAVQALTALSAEAEGYVLVDATA
jgi:hypothetical protein